MPILADSGFDQVTPAIVGIVVLILLQLAQFFFAYRRDSHASEAAKKADLQQLRTELKNEIADVQGELDEHAEKVDRKLDAMRRDSYQARTEIHDRVTEVSQDTAKLLEASETTKQTMANLSSKLDRLIERKNP